MAPSPNTLAKLPESGSKNSFAGKNRATLSVKLWSKYARWRHIMKHVVWSLAICLVSIPLLHAQQRPTLGPSGSGAPSLRGPVSSRTINRKKLLKMRKIYIQRIDHNLNEILTKDFAHVSWVKVVDEPSKADAIVRGTCFSLRSLKRLHAEIYISDRVTGAAIWEDVVRVPYNPPDLSKAVDNAAARFLGDLNQSIQLAGSR